MRKNVLLFLVCTMMCGLLISGCGKKNEGASEADAQSSEESASGDSKKKAGSAEEKAIAAATAFAEALMSEEYEKAVEEMDIADSTFVFAEDIEWYLPRSSYSEFEELAGGEVVDAAASEGYDAYDVTLTIALDEEVYEADVLVNLSDDNEWKVEADDFCVTDWYINTPGGEAELKVNDIVVSERYLEGTIGDNDLAYLYKIPAAGKAEKQLSVTVPAKFDKIELTALPESNSEDNATMMEYDFSGEIEEELYEAVKNIWNELHALYIEGKDKGEAISYLSSDADTDILAEIWSGFDNITDGSSFTLTDFRVTEVKNWQDHPSLLLTDNIVGVNFQYALKWNHSLLGDEEMKASSSLILKYEEDGYKIYRISSSKYFDYANAYTKDW